MIGDKELVEAVVEVEVLVIVVEVTTDDIENDIDDMVYDEDNDNSIILADMDEDEEIAGDLPKETTFGPEAGIPFYESDVEDF